MITRLILLHRVLHNGQLNPGDLQALQLCKLQETLQLAWEHVPYYRHLFNESGIHPRDISGPDDLRKIPVSTKDDLRNAGTENLVACNVDTGKLTAALTSGTSGKPFRVMLSARERKLRRYIDFRTLLNVGFRPRDQLVTLGPRLAMRRGLHEHLGLFRTDRLNNRLPPHEIVRQLESLRPDILWVYPSILRSLLVNVGRDALRGFTPRAIINAAETEDRSLLRKAWDEADIEYFNFYGSIETGRIAWECRAHEGLHVNTDHVLLELEPIQGMEAGTSGGPGHVVITTLNMRSMPFIRYRLGDLCSLVKGDCPCGSSYPRITSPIGRENSLAKLSSGRHVSALEFTRVLRQFDWIEQFRVTQLQQGKFTIAVLASDPANDAKVAHVHAALIKQLGEPADIMFTFVRKLEQVGDKFLDFIIAGTERP